jgi:acyl-CoA synthetase (AMP-forming)/AMP-acid ligase II
VLKPGMSLSDEELREFVKGNLARYKVPRDVRFLDELPRNPTGKVLKRRLREVHAAGRTATPPAGENPLTGPGRLSE